ncbi:hypothetical protein F4679DRAFT_406296 [Xylaria curta]|nr:hypothetical protein F4679DRAFT_406296 [Xylaria curta]
MFSGRASGRAPRRPKFRGVRSHEHDDSKVVSVNSRDLIRNGLMKIESDTERRARESAIRFTQFLTYRSGAHVWGESALARFGYDGLISQLDTVLTAYSTDLLETGNPDYCSFAEAIGQNGRDICIHFCETIQSHHSIPEVVCLHSNDIGATEQNYLQNKDDTIGLSGTNSSTGEASYRNPPQDPLDTAGVFISNEGLDSLSRLVREKLYSASRLCIDNVKEAFKLANGHRLSTKDSLYDTPTTFVPESSEFVIETDLSLLHYVKDNFPGQRIELATLVTITGTAFYAHATTCLQYLKETWPDTGEILLPILQKAIREIIDHPEMTVRFVTEHNQLWTISTELSQNGTLKLLAKGPEVFVVDIIQQLCWLTATFSTPPSSEKDIVYCMSTVESIPDLARPEPILKLDTSFTKLLVDEENPCWLSLFSNAVIACGFPIPVRTNSIGLEMSVDLMAAIIGARHAGTFDGGIVIKGFSSMFLPVMRTRDGIQWHYVANTNPDMQLSYDKGVRRCPNRSLLSDVDFTSLETARCFIGWNSLVEIRVGDDMDDFDNIEFSDATEVKSTFQIPRASVGFQQFGLAQIDVTFGKRDGKCHFQRSSSYRRIVIASEKMFVTLFDTGERRGYLVAASRLLLHILRHRISLGRGGVPASEIKIVSAESITETLFKNAKLRLSSEEDESLFLDDVVSEVWSILELLQAQSIATERNDKIEIHATWQERLLGYEYMAIVEDWSPMPLKELEIHKTCGGWPRLARDVNALVLLANGFGELIRPIDNQKILCHQWKTLPQNKDYIAVPVNVLLRLYRLAGCSLSKKQLTPTNLQLHGEGTVLFQPCPTPEEQQCSCNRLQQIISNSSLGRICVPKLIEDNGAVIIGQSGSLLNRFTRSTPKITRILSHTNIALHDKLPANWNSDTSGSSIPSESSDFHHSNTNSPVSLIDDRISLKARMLKLRERMKDSQSKITKSDSFLSSNGVSHPPRLAKQPHLGESSCHAGLPSDSIT